ncbi:RNA polymerase sigma factor [bacterium]|nr:RNA polymerase sigma factor [bacterium]
MELTRADAVVVRNERFVSHYEEVHLRAWRLALYLCGRREDAEDLLAEAVAHAIRGFDKLKNITSFHSWFLKILRNLHLDHYRSRKRQLDVADFGGDNLIWERLSRYPTMPGPQRQAELRDVFRALDRLPEGLRTPLALSALDGYSLQEIGEIMGLKAGTVKVRIHRARKKLSAFLGDDFEVDR